MFRRPSPWLAKYQPFAMTYQGRFRWRHRDIDPFRRLIDSTCFTTDSLRKPREPNLSQFGGHWSHIITCAHVIAPWEYPNFYPPTGVTRWISKLTLSDTLGAVRVNSLQGEAIYKHFTSNHLTFVHRNPRLDLAVIHSEQNFKRLGESKMLWMQNEGYNIRTRFEVLEELEEGDHVWIYGYIAKTQLFDEEAPADPLMIPVGIHGKVKSRESEHFFVEPLPGEPEMAQGLCGAPVMRKGKCVGMLTATVHPDSENKTLAGTAMCTYAEDIREFLLEVEKQLENPLMHWHPQNENEYMKKREEEQGVPNPTNKVWEDDETRIARHIPVPMTQWRIEEYWATEEDRQAATVFNRSGPFNQEVQENFMDLDIDTSKNDGNRPDEMHAQADGGKKPNAVGDRPDVTYHRVGTHAPAENWKRHSQWETKAGQEAADFVKGSVDNNDSDMALKMAMSMEGLRVKKAQEEVQKTAMKAVGEQYEAAQSGAAQYGGGGSAAAKQTTRDKAAATEETGRGGAPSGSADSTSSTAAASAASESGSASKGTPNFSGMSENQRRIWQKKLARREAEAKAEEARRAEQTKRRPWDKSGMDTERDLWREDHLN